MIDNWRASHAFPLQVFFMNLKRRATDDTTLVAQRLKRLESIVDKLGREQGMELYRMQDLGGCRMVVSTVKDVYEKSEEYKNSRIRHELKKVNDYIENPKKSGYRSLHLVYRYVSDKDGKDVYEKYPLLIELQFRSHLQHLWATAVETMGVCTNQALKAGKGSAQTKRFFVLVSSIFALMEGCPVVPGTSDDIEALVKELKKIDSENHILLRLQGIREVIDHEYGKEKKAQNKKGYVLLVLNYKEHTVETTSYAPGQIEKANSKYDQIEKHLHSEGKDLPLDVVLVRAKSMNAVKAAYPNYFMDIKEFLETIREYLK